MFDTLEYPKGSPTYQIKQLGKDEVMVLKIQTTRQRAPSKMISESSLHKLVMRSDKPQVRPFQDWVTKTVLPAIRKNGEYVVGEETFYPPPDLSPIQPTRIIS